MLKMAALAIETEIHLLFIEREIIRLENESFHHLLKELKIDAKINNPLCPIKGYTRLPGFMKICLRFKRERNYDVMLVDMI